MIADLPLIVLAAGDSLRMGRPKGLMEVDGMPLLAWQLARFHAAGGRQTVVVLGAHAEDYLCALPDLCSVVNPRPEGGPFSSLQLGIEWVQSQPFQGRGCFVLPVDVPAPEVATWQSLATHLSGKTQVVRPRYQGRGGHPVLLSAELAVRILRFDRGSDDARLDRQIHQLDARVVVDVAVDDAAVALNLNDGEAWDAWRSSPRGLS